MQCPRKIIDYNKCMGGVDVGDYLRVLYGWRNKSKRIVIPVCAYMLMTATNNAFLLRRVKEHRHYKSRKRT